MKNVLKSFGYMLFYSIFQMIVMSMIASIVGSAYGSKEQVELFMNNNMMVLTVISNIFTIIIFVLYFKVRKKNLLKEVNIKTVGIKKYMLPCIITFSYSMAFSLLTIDANFENANILQTAVEHYSSLMHNLGTIMYIIAVLIVAPITEEFIYRGLILTELKRKYNNTIAIIVGALLFGVSHIMAGGGILLVGSFIVGII
ncbi:MAG: CPBP family intramembrane metalloprotease, partial [Erysipelotrichia bacterium]|nr:CPBP family intramembrane metalloprotease [Erysipelotrichia bacterium]